MRFEAYREPFRYRGFGPLYLAYTISKLGDWIYLVGFSLWLLQLTQSPALMAMVTALQTVPRVLLGAVTGSIADRVNRARLMMLCDLLQALLVLPLLLVQSKSQLPIVYVVAFCLSLLSAQASAAKGPLIATILPRDSVVKGNALINATESVIIMVGPAVAAWAIARFGFQTTFLMNAASFLLSAVILQVLASRAVPPTPAEHDADHSFAASIAGFFQSIRTPGLLRQLLLVVSLLALAQGTVQALHTPLLMQFVGLTEQQYAIVLALQGIGGVAGSYVIIPLSERYAPKVLLTVGMLLGAVTTGLLVLYPSFWMVAALTLADGLFFTGIFVAIPSLVQQSTADSVMGRAFAALDATENGFMLLSMTVSGLLVSFASMRTLFIGVAALMVLGSWVAFRTLHDASAASLEPAAGKQT